MMECYYPWCSHHNKDEPICKYLDTCRATAEELAEYEQLRQDSLEKSRKLRQESSYHGIPTQVYTSGSN